VIVDTPHQSMRAEIRRKCPLSSPPDHSVARP
jgi:hypothetical protein